MNKEQDKVDWTPQPDMLPESVAFSIEQLPDEERIALIADAQAKIDECTMLIDIAETVRLTANR